MPIGAMRLASTEKSGCPGTKLKPAGWTRVMRTGRSAAERSEDQLAIFARGIKQVVQSLTVDALRVRIVALGAVLETHQLVEGIGRIDRKACDGQDVRELGGRP